MEFGSLAELEALLNSEDELEPSCIANTVMRDSAGRLHSPPASAVAAIEGLRELLCRKYRCVSERSLYPDTFFLRFLRACDFELEDTHTMLDKSLQWRADLRVDGILNDRVSRASYMRLCGLLHLRVIGFAPDGSPVHYLQLGNSAVDRVLEESTIEEIHRFQAFHSELLIRLASQESRRRREHNHLTTAVINMQGLGREQLSPRAFNLAKSLSSAGQENFPDVQGKMLVLNTGIFVSGIWKVVRLWMDPVTRAKVEFLPRDAEASYTRLKEVVGDRCAEILRVQLDPGAEAAASSDSSAVESRSSRK